VAINYFNSLIQISLNELISKYGDDNTLVLLKSFTCTKNSDLERFLIDPKKAISFNKRGLAKTYLFMDDNLNIIAYYSISLKVFF